LAPPSGLPSNWTKSLNVEEQEQEEEEEEQQQESDH
jgi:hypothetical protein